jgi:hypothetical protein
MFMISRSKRDARKLRGSQRLSRRLARDLAKLNGQKFTPIEILAYISPHAQGGFYFDLSRFGFHLFQKLMEKKTRKSA